MPGRLTDYWFVVAPKVGGKLDMVGVEVVVEKRWIKSWWIGFFLF